MHKLTFLSSSTLQQQTLIEIFMLGFDQWSDGLGKQEYIKHCLASPKYKKGQWHMLLNNKQIIASLIIYKAPLFNLPNNAIGLGSIVCSQNLRNQGYASKLINKVKAIYAGKMIYLHSDINPSLYKKHGFKLINQANNSTHCMLLSTANVTTNQIPEYF